MNPNPTPTPTPTAEQRPTPICDQIISTHSEWKGRMWWRNVEIFPADEARALERRNAELAQALERLHSEVLAHDFNEHWESYLDAGSLLCRYRAQQRPTDKGAE